MNYIAYYIWLKHRGLLTGYLLLLLAPPLSSFVALFTLIGDYGWLVHLILEIILTVYVYARLLVSLVQIILKDRVP